ncbi:MAG: aminoacyl-tRNA hydrolase [Bacilli bacterium]|nr:aminoacyl-tRNA hydrolase [Bacilli bacterium]
MKLVVGLGNPGKEYVRTRHNVGFLVVDNFADKNNLSFNLRFDGLYTEFLFGSEKVILLKPQKFMNLSGEVVKRYVDYYKISIDDVLIVSDDLDLDVGVYRLRNQGSSGGHNGLKNIEVNLNTTCYKRLKIGIANNKLIDTKDYVLGKFSTEEYDSICEIIDLSFDIINDFLKLDFPSLMNKYNHR